MASTMAVGPEIMVTLKVNIEGNNKRFKLPLRDLNATVLPDKVRGYLSSPARLYDGLTRLSLNPDPFWDNMN